MIRYVNKYQYGLMIRKFYLKNLPESYDKSLKIKGEDIYIAYFWVPRKLLTQFHIRLLHKL